MKVILLRDVAKLGKRLSVVEVADGRGQNQLIPRGLALPATPENLKRAKEQNAQKGAASDASAAVFAEATNKLVESKMVVKVESNEKGHLFQAIKAEQIVEAAGQLGANLSVSQIQFENPIKSLGEHEVTLRHADKAKIIKISVEKK